MHFLGIHRPALNQLNYHGSLSDAVMHIRTCHVNSVFVTQFMCEEVAVQLNGSVLTSKTLSLLSFCFFDVDVPTALARPRFHVMIEWRDIMG